jgi:hypothetical protein
VTIESIIQERKISRVLHFTTSPGLIGILASKAVLSRKRLTREKYLEHIAFPNCEIRQDPDWLDHVNLSIEKINTMFLSYAKNGWHAGADLFWCVLSFDPQILKHDEVWFATTNNSYSTVMHCQGASGLSALYAETVKEKPPYVKTRTAKMCSALTTSPQAEVLYPGQLDIKHLREILVSDEKSAEEANGHLEVFNLTIPITVMPEAFR